MSSNSRWFLDTQHSFSFKAEHENSCCSNSNKYKLYYIKFYYFELKQATSEEFHLWGGLRLIGGLAERSFGLLLADKSIVLQ